MTTGFLITTLSGRLKVLSGVVNDHVLKKLYIYVSVNRNQSSIRNNEWVSKKIVDLYSSSFQLFPNLDVRIILNGLKREDQRTNLKNYNVDIIILPKHFNHKISDLEEYFRNLPVVYVDDLLADEEQNNTETYKIYKNVVLGGTFDRLHTGHKILLSEALLRCSNKLTVGVTDGDMIKGKKLWELIEPCPKRISAVERFIHEVDESVKYEVVAINDMFGPTKSDPNLDMIVVSAETEKGGLKVNELRKANGLGELDIHTVNLVEDSENLIGVEEEKISSSNVRMRLLGTYLKAPEVKSNIPRRPYIIGLTGGVASGKSSICEYLKQLGAAVIDCDKIGHQLYRPGASIYEELIQTFGDQIVLENGEINKRMLGLIVFSDKEKLDLLNNLMWPSIYKEAKEECERLCSEEQKDIIILEAAVLLQAGWQTGVHEVWGTIIPREEAIKRLKDRNSFTRAEAISRIDSQLKNTEIVENCNVIFCSLWSYDYTRSQVSRAWRTLMASIK